MGFFFKKKSKRRRLGVVSFFGCLISRITKGGPRTDDIMFSHGGPKVDDGLHSGKQGGSGCW